jgi:hypothetical protein
MTQERMIDELACIYQGSIAWRNETGRVLVIACADGRFRDAREEFLRQYCQIQRADAILFPGGPASFLISAPWFFALRPQIEFLQKAHDVQRLIAVAHDDCAYYGAKYPQFDVIKRKSQQIADLRECREDLRKLIPGIVIELYYEQSSHDVVHYYVVS